MGGRRQIIEIVDGDQRDFGIVLGVSTPAPGLSGGVLAIAFLLRHARVHEDFLSVTLLEAMRPHNGVIAWQSYSHLDREAPWIL